MEERNVRPGEFYRHFKDKLYQILAVATHSETGEPMVVYQALYGDFKVYVRPYDMFVSEVDHEKYPDVAQKYRFEQVVLQAVSGAEIGTGAGGGVDAPAGAGMPEGTVVSPTGMNPQSTQGSRGQRTEANPALLHFLDADNYDQQMECLKKLSETAEQADLDSIYVVLDMKPEDGSVQEQIDAVGRFLSMQNRYDGSRLR